MRNHEDTKDTKDTKTHENSFVQNVDRAPFVIFVPSWFLLCR